MKTLILILVLISSQAQAQYMNHMNDGDNTAGRDWSPNPLHPQPVAPYVQPTFVNQMPNIPQPVTCHTFFGATTCN